ncbi:MAG: hypothetical protein WCC26_00910 [Terracidiphilus sp.]
MERWLATAMVSGIAMMCGPTAPGQALVNAPQGVTTAAGESLTLPPIPSGKTTIFGGEIRNIDPVRDQLTLNVFGQRPMRILFDERTHVYLDGKRVPLRNLAAVKHASVETTLDGTNIFAVSIHSLSQIPEAAYEGRVLSYNSATGELIVANGLSPDQFRVLVQRDTSIVREGQSSFASAAGGAGDLKKGSLVSIDFAVGRSRDAVANKVEILAVPGSAFAFSGNISWIDLHAGLLVLTDPRDQKEHQIAFNAASLPEVRDLHLGDGVRVVASYDGARYLASKVSVTKP